MTEIEKLRADLDEAKAQAADNLHAAEHWCDLYAKLSKRVESGEDPAALARKVEAMKRRLVPPERERFERLEAEHNAEVEALKAKLREAAKLSDALHALHHGEYEECPVHPGCPCCR